MLRRAVVAVAAFVLVLVAAAGPATAHVTVQPGEAVQGSFTKLAFRVPNEEDDAATVKLEVQLPPEIESARTKPVPGWTAATAGRTITWEGGRIEPGEFQEFEISVGPLPDVDEVVFKAIQTYDNGIVARWIDEVGDDGDEPEHPAPVLRLAAAADGEEQTVAAEPVVSSVDQDEVDGARTLGIAGIVVGALGLVAGVAGLLARRRP